MRLSSQCFEFKPIFVCFHDNVDFPQKKPEVFQKTKQWLQNWMHLLAGSQTPTLKADIVELYGMMEEAPLK